MPEDYDSFDSQQRRKFWKDHIEQWRESGLSQRAYCKKFNLITHRFYDWKRRLLPAEKNQVSFLPVALGGFPSRPPSSVRIHTPNGFTIEIENQTGSAEIGRLLKMVAAL